MKTKGSVAVACFCAAVGGCTGAISWESACGCVPASVGIAEDLKLDPNTQFTPVVLAEAVEKRLSSVGVPVHLDGVRSIGLAFQEGCYKRAEFRLRCTFWLWYNDGTNRGIELNVLEDGFAISDDSQFSAHYVYESSSR